MDSSSTFLDMFETMDFGCPEVIIAVIMTALVMLCIMYFVLSHSNSLWNKVDEDDTVTDNESLAKNLKFYCLELHFNIKNYFTVDDEDIRDTAMRSGLPAPTDEAVLYARKAVELYTSSLFARIDNDVHVVNEARRDSEKHQKRAAANTFALKSTILMFYAAVTCLMLLQSVYHKSLARPTTNQTSLPTVFDFATVIEQSYSKNVTPAYVNSIPITEWEGQALFQLLHGSEDDTNTICCDDDDFVCITSSFVSKVYNTIGLWASSLVDRKVRDASSTQGGSLSSIFDFAAVIEQSYGQEVTPFYPSSAVPMTKSEGQALHALLYGTQVSNDEQGQEPTCFGMLDCTCCDEDDLVCLGSSALSKIRRDIGDVCNRMTDFFMVSKGRIKSAFSSAFDRNLGTIASDNAVQTCGDSFWNQLKPMHGASMDTKIHFPAKKAVSDNHRVLWTGAGNCRFSGMQEWVAPLSPTKHTSVPKYFDEPLGLPSLPIKSKPVLAPAPAPFHGKQSINFPKPRRLNHTETVFLPSGPKISLEGAVKEGQRIDLALKKNATKCHSPSQQNH